MEIKRASKALSLIGVAVIISLLIVSGWWAHVLISRSQPPTTIADIAYDNIRRGRDVDYRIFIEENGELVPYLVLTANYGGNVLLLREHLLDEARPFNPSPHGRERMWGWSDFGAYYPNSDIDDFLNTEFKDTLGEGVVTAMTPSDIVVTDKDSIGGGGRGDISRVITRYVFLLSIREMGVPDPRITVPEGYNLRYFRNDFTRRIASLSDGREIPYWTRTPSTMETYLVFIIGINVVSFDVAGINSGVRPAFALARSTAITTSTNSTTGESIFVLDN